MNHLEPEAIWRNFASLNAIPRCSKKEEKVIAFAKAFGENLGLDTTVDETGNVIIRKPATQGMENRKTIVLQAHLDMVCQKNNDVEFDFDTQGIQTYVDGDWLKAKGTTLGADNGIGAATILSILESNTIVHPPLEALFTIDEETGMTGAIGLKPGVLKGEILLNLDTEEDDEIDIGCAGGVDVTATKQFPTKDFNGEVVTLDIKGLAGGHSGMDIQKGLGNANVLLRRFLFAALPHGAQLLSIDSGGARNAIPREGHASFAVEDSATFLTAIQDLKTQIEEEYKSLERELSITIAKAMHSGKILSQEDSEAIILALKAAHNGVYRMSPEVKGLVEASNNIARVELKDGAFKVLCLSRSSVESTKADVAEQLKSSFELAGIPVEFSNAYPGWTPNPHSEIAEILERIYKEKFKEAPHIEACHAGLECGIIGATYPDMEMISFGPTIRGAHSPEERVSISSVQKFWSYLQDILKAIPEKE